jgi:tRNA threonylcarbamoyladenosine biosynthesis protein TsaB
MMILAIDSASNACDVCVWRDGEVIAAARETMARGQDARLMPMIVETMARAGVSFHDLDRVAVTRGPGSFTGLRVGLAAARGIGLAANKPVIGIDRFSLYNAACAQAGRDLLVVIESKRADLFCRFYPAADDAPEPCLMTQADIDAFLAAHAPCAVAGDVATPQVEAAQWAARLAADAPLNHPDFLPRPLYLRAPDVTMPKPQEATHA